MLKASILRNGMALVSMRCRSPYARPRRIERVGITHRAMLQVQDLRSVGRAMNAPNDFPVMASQSAGLIVAERTPVHVSATEAASLLDDLRLQLAAQPNARLSIHWRLTQPAEIK